MLEIHEISLGYSKKQDIIQSVSAHIRQGELTAVIGPNGSGKSTLLKAVAANLPLRKGIIRLDGKSIKDYPTRTLAKKIAFLPQSPSAPPDYTVKDLVSYGRFPHLGWTGRMQTLDWDIVHDSIALTHLSSYADRPVSNLSGGERQRAWIAMALAQKPQLLILDEPTTHLDISYQFEVLELVKSLNTGLGITTLIVLHDLNQAARFADRIIALKEGKIVKMGQAGDIFNQKEIETIFQIRVGIEQDRFNNCPLLIPIQSKRTITHLKRS